MTNDNVSVYNISKEHQKSLGAARTDELNYAIGKTSTHESRNLRIMHLHG